MEPTFNIPPLAFELEDQLRRKIDTKTKPLGALGRLESIAMRIGLIQGTLNPVLNRPHVVVFAADHGISEEGVSAYPQDVTWQMVLNFLAGGAAINVFAEEFGLALRIVDAGVKHDFRMQPSLCHAKIAAGTRNSVIEPAMSRSDAVKAIQIGASIAHDVHCKGANVLGLGEMGIGNSSAAALLLHKLAGVDLAVATGRGTGLDDTALAHKLAVLRLAAARTPPSMSPMEALVEYGGFEIAMMAGAMLAAAERRMVTLVDGFIAGSALLVAYGLNPQVSDYVIFSHRSAESGHGAMLSALQGQPLLALDLRLGEATGAALAYPIVRAAVAFLSRMSSFESAQVSTRAS